MKTDAEVLKEGIDALLGKLGLEGTMLFIAEIKRDGQKNALSAFDDAAAAFEGEAGKVRFEIEEEFQEYEKDPRRRIDIM